MIFEDCSYGGPCLIDIEDNVCKVCVKNYYAYIAGEIIQEINKTIWLSGTTKLSPIGDIIIEHIEGYLHREGDVSRILGLYARGTKNITLYCAAVQWESFDIDDTFLHELAHHIQYSDHILSGDKCCIDDEDHGE